MLQPKSLGSYGCSGGEPAETETECPSVALAMTAGFLVPKVLADYRTFVCNPAPSESKAFAAFHSACRAALSHLELLVKLTGDQMPDERREGEDDTSLGIDKLITEARDVLAQHSEIAE